MEVEHRKKAGEAGRVKQKQKLTVKQPVPDFIGDVRAVVINVLTELKETMTKSKRQNDNVT